MGDISPCCKFQTKGYKQKFNIQSSSVADYADSEFLNDVKQEFLDEKWPQGCERCRIEEENNIDSKRILDYTRWKNHYQSYELSEKKFITASLAFGNTCNLKCITCGPYSSSQWRKEYRDIYQVDIQHFKFYKENFVSDFVESAPDIIHIDIPGGEPFLSGITEQKQLLSYYIDTNQASNITLHYTTNATVYPDETWWELWRHFKEVDIQLSIDGVAERQEYIRYPSKWNDIVRNTQKYLNKVDFNIRLSVSHTVSAYNILYLDEFFSWCYNIGLPRPWLGRVHTPAYMRPSVWPEKVKKIIIEKLKTSTHTDCQLWANLLTCTDDSDAFEEFKNKLHAHDQYRGIDFKKTFTELAEFI